MLQNSSVAATTTATMATSAGQQQQQHQQQQPQSQSQQQQQQQMPQPKLVVIRRRPNQGFGFTLRHFIAYPPEDDPSWPQEASEPYQVKAMETIFIKEVHPNGPAYYANLQTGDRVLMVNNTPIAGIAYSTIVSMIKQTPSELKLLVVPKECDVLQMHYTSIAHTPQSNVTAAAPTPCPPAKAMSSPIAPIVAGNGNATSSRASNSSSSSGSAGALLPMSVASAGRPFPLQHHLHHHHHHHQQQQQQQHQLISFPAAQQQSSRSGSISSTTSNLRPLAASDYMELTSTQTMSSSSSATYAGNILLHSDSGSYLRSPPPAVLTRQQQLQQQQQQHHLQQQQQQQNSATIYASNAPADKNDLMIRLRESIKQKEEFLKSPLPNVHQTQYTAQYQQPQHFFPHTPPSGSPQLSVVSTSSTSVGGSSTGGAVNYLAGGNAARGQVRAALVKQPLSATSSSSSTRELLSSCDMHYAPILGSGAVVGGTGVGTGGTYGSTARSHQQQQQQQQQQHRKFTTTSSSGSGMGLRDIYHKDYEFMETLQETGVTNKVFESKLVSHLARDFDPFKPLSINTNAFETPTAATATAAVSTAAGNAIMKKQSVLYDSLQHHPLHQMQVQQQHQYHLYQQQQQLQLQHQPPATATTAPKMTVSNAAAAASSSSSATSGASAVDGRYGRMEIHKASLATTTIDHQSTNNTNNNNNICSSSSIHGKYSSKLTDVNETKPTLAEGDATSSGGATTSAATRAATAAATAAASAAASSTPSAIAAAAPLATAAAGGSNTNISRRFRPMSSFDETKPMRRISYLRATNDDYHCDTSTASLGNLSNSSIAETLSTKSSGALPQHIEEHPDPIYDVVGGGSGHAGDSTSESLDALEDLKLDASCSSRRTSINSDLRHSIHIDNISNNDLNGKLDSKDTPTDLEVFETEMEIKSSSIHGKRQSEYRSWRQVKIEIKGDILKIYPSRNTKSDNNVLELDIRNFKIFDESDKKKHVFRMQSKPSPIATLGNELNIDDANDKLTSSTGSSSSNQQHAEAATSSQQQNQPHTDILFKTKSSTEMIRIFGLLQWKNSFIYDDNDLQGKQMAEPQKTAATATYCDDNVQQQQQQQQHLQAEHSPLSSTSRSELEAGDSISPIMKTRKSSSHKNIPDKDLGSPKAKNWKDLLFRRGGGSSSSSHSADLSPSNLSSSSKIVGSIGVPLKRCPMSKNNEYVPTLVEVCTNIVETKGLGVVGIYRIPGNKAAISELSDQVNKTDFTWDRCNTDVRWEDVNVVSSLLKLFIRSLPDALLPRCFYNQFIEADKMQGMERLKEIKQLLEALPRYSHETMKHLFRHLNRVSKNCDVNLMEPKNLAIIFGPSIIRTPNDTLDIAVKDMKHQCRIVELLLTHYDYFFENGETPDVEDICGNNVAASTSSSATGVSLQQQQQEDHTNMLLHNISKIERLTERESSSSSTTTTTRTSRFIPHLRKRTTSKRPEPAYSGDSAVSLDYSKSASGTTASSSSSSSTTTTSSTKSKKKEAGFLSGRGRGHGRKGSLDEKDSGSGGSSIMKEPQRNSVDISITLTDDESSNSRLSDTGSMSLGMITDTLDSKLSKLRSGSESNDENGSPDFPIQRRYTLGEPLIMHTENIPYADESPERHFINFNPMDNITSGNNLMLSRSCTSTNTLLAAKSAGSEKEKPHSSVQLSTGYKMAHKLQHSATAPINSNISSVGSAGGGGVGGGLVSPPSVASTPAAATVGALKGGLTASTARNLYATSKNLRFSSSVHEQRCSEDDSEGSTTSDPKEALVMASPSFPLDNKFNKKRRDHRLYRSASFNCRNYSSRYSGMGAGGNMPALTKDEKTDMNLTKKRQIQNNKQNRSIKRRHTVGGPHDYNSTNGGGQPATNNCNHHCKGGSGGQATASANNSGSGLRRMPLSSANGNIAHNNNNNMHNENGGSGSASSNGNNSSSSGGGGGVGGNSSSSANTGGSAAAATVNVANAAGEHVLEVGIRIKNINRARF